MPACGPHASHSVIKASTAGLFFLIFTHFSLARAADLASNKTSGSDKLRGLNKRRTCLSFCEVSANDHTEVSVFTGPVFASNDPHYREIRVPLQFYEIVAHVDDGQLKAIAWPARLSS